MFKDLGEGKIAFVFTNVKGNRKKSPGGGKLYLSIPHDQGQGE